MADGDGGKGDASRDALSDGGTDFARGARPDGCLNGTGGPLSFGAAITAKASFPQQAIAADFDRDGQMDVAYVGGFVHDHIFVSRGAGDGTLAPPSSYAIPESAPWDGNLAPLLAADLDADGRLDLLTVSRPGEISVLLGGQGGGFPKFVKSDPVPKDDLANSPLVRNFAVADFGAVRKEHLFDLMVAGETSGPFLGIGKGAFNLVPDAVVGFETIHFRDRDWSSVAIADLDEDGLDDYVACADTGMDLGRGRGDGTFVAFPGPPPTNKYCAGAVAVVDLNRDGHADLVWGQGNPFVVLGDGHGTFGKENRACEAGEFGPAVSLADFDGDGILDIVGSHGAMETSLLSICLGRGDGSFDGEVTFPVPSFYKDSIPSIAIGDFNKDCRPDLVITDDQSQRIHVLLNTTP